MNHTRRTSFSNGDWQTQELEVVMSKWLKGNKTFWSPIALGWGLTIFLVGMTYIIVSRSTEWLGWFNVAFGIAFALLGIILSPTRNKQFWAAVLLRSGLALVFFGIVLATIYLLAGWLVIIVGIVLLYLGHRWAPK